MNFNNFTIKAQEVVQKAVELTRASGNQAIEPEHLLKAVLTEGDAIVRFIFQKLDINPVQVEKSLEESLSRLPRVSGGEPYLSNDASKVLEKANDIASKVVRMVWRTDCGLVVADDGCFYAIRENAMWKYPNNGGVHPDLSNKLNDKGIERFSFEKLTGSFYGEYHGMYYDSANNAIYLPVRNQLLKFSLDSQEWSEAYAFSNEDRSFTCINYAPSRVFAHTNDYSKPFYVWGGMDLAGQPQTFDKLNTGIKLGQSPYESPVEVSLVQSMYGDSQGNLWLQVSDMQFVVYNPNGIKGYTAMIGKSTRHEIPQEE